MSDSSMPRKGEPELMDDAAEARAYAAADFAQVNQAFADRLLALAGPMPRARALDLGSGPADIPLRVVRARPQWRVTALDGSPAMLRHARRAVQAAGLMDAIELVLADAKDTHLPPACFDVIFSNSILHHIADADRFWAELKRLGRPGALVLLRDLARPADEQAARQIVQRYAAAESPVLREEYFRSLLSAYTVAEVQVQLARAGLSSLQVSMVTDRHLDVFGRLP